MVDGKRRSEGYPSQEEAEARRDEVAALLTLKSDPRRVAAEKAIAPLFVEIAEEALDDHAKAEKLRPSTYSNHRTFLDKHLLPHFGDQPVTVEHFSRVEIRRWINEKKKSLKDSTLSSCLPTLRLILDHAVETNVLATNPMRGGKRLLRVEQRSEPVDPFTPEELRAILTAAGAVDPDFCTLIQIMAQTSLRPGEALALRRCDLDMTKARVHVQGTFSRGRIGPTKNRQSVRVVSLLHPICEPESRGWHPRDAGPLTKRVLAGLRSLRVISVDPEARLFELRQAFFHERWTRVLAKAQVRYRKPHALRHAFASVMLSRNAPLVYVVKCGGWANANVLLSVYAHWIEEGAEVASNLASNDLTPRRVAVQLLDQ